MVAAPVEVVVAATPAPTPVIVPRRRARTPSDEAEPADIELQRCPRCTLLLPCGGEDGRCGLPASAADIAGTQRPDFNPAAGL